eukprot:gene34202-41402_t
MSESIIIHQKQALIDTIKEAQKKENQRLKRLSIATKAEFRQLSDRYDRERQLEQEKIEHLRADLMTLHKKRSEGTLNISAEERREAQKELHRLNNSQYQTEVSRFYGMESLEDVLFHADVTKRFEKHDQRFILESSKIRYDPMEDIRKLRLLDEKKRVLQQLIAIEDKSSIPHTRSLPRPSDTYSQYSSSTGVSYATFATGTSSRGRAMSVGRAGRPKVNIPRLPI